MAYLILQTQQVPLWNWGGSAAKLRVFASQSFYEATTGALTPQGQVTNPQSACQIYDCTVSGTTLTIPEVTLPTTTDSNVPNAVLTCVLYDSTDAPRFTLLSQAFVDPSYFQVPVEASVLVTDAGTTSVNAYYLFSGTSAGFDYYNVEGESASITLSAIVNSGSAWKMYDAAGDEQYTTSNNPASPWDGIWVEALGSLPVPIVSESLTTVTSTWEQLTLSNQASATVGAPFQWNAPFWSVNQTKEYVNNLVGDGTTPYSSSLAAGKTYLSADPLLASHPIAVGTNDERWIVITNQKYLSIDYDNDLAQAVTDIGSTPTQLFVSIASDAIASNVVCPATLLLTFVDDGSLNVNSGRTVTIGLMSPAPSKQIFTGLGSVVFAKNGVDEKDLSWWAGNSSVADTTRAFNQMLTNGGRCFVPSGIWYCTNVTVPSYTVLRGAGCNGGDATNSTVIGIYDLVTATCVLKASEAFREIVLQDLTISVIGSTASSCFRAQGTAPNTAVGLKLSNVSFHGTGTGAPAQFHIKDLGSQWQLEECLLDHCSWITPTDGTCYRSESVNTSVYIRQGLFGTGANATVIDGQYIGFLTLDQCQAAGIGLSGVPRLEQTNRTIKGSITSGTFDLTITTGSISNNDLGCHVIISGKLDAYITEVLSSTTCTVDTAASASATTADLVVKEWLPNPARANTFVHAVNQYVSINLLNCTDEGFNYFLVCDNSDLVTAAPINIVGATYPQSWIQLNDSCVVNMQGSHLFSQTFRDDVGCGARLIMSGNTIVQQTVVGTLVSTLSLEHPTIWGVHDGATLIQTAFNSNYPDLRQSLGIPTTMNYGQEYASSPDTDTGFFTITSSVDTTGGPHIKLQRLGRSDSTTELPDFYYDFCRNFDNGFLELEGSQTAPNAGFQYRNGPIIADQFSGNSVSPAAITTDAGTYYPLQNKQNVRMISTGDHTIGGVVFPAVNSSNVAVPGIGNYYFWNVDTVDTITFLHQSGGDAAVDRIICDTGDDIACQPGEMMHLFRDITTDRWRASKGNITGITSDGATIALDAVNVAASGTFSVDTGIEINGAAPLITSDQTGTGNIVMSVSPDLTGNPTAPTQSVNNDSTRIATTAFVGMLRSYLASSATYNNTAALANTALSVTVAAAGVYKIELTVFATSAVKGLNMDWAGTSTQTSFLGQWQAYDVTTTATTASAKVTAAGTDFGPGAMDAIAASIYTFNGIVTVNAGGTFLLRGAQNAADASNTVILAGSNLLLTKMN